MTALIDLAMIKDFKDVHNTAPCTTHNYKELRYLHYSLMYAVV